MSLKGTLEYMAPEMIKRQAKYTEKVDIFSLGVIVYELYTRKFPYAFEHGKELAI